MQRELVACRGKEVTVAATEVERDRSGRKLERARESDELHSQRCAEAGVEQRAPRVDGFTRVASFQRAPVVWLEQAQVATARDIEAVAALAAPVRSLVGQGQAQARTLHASGGKNVLT